jgi:hypothetical protein
MILQILRQEVKAIAIFLQEISAVFSFEGKCRLWELQPLAKDLQ